MMSDSQHLTANFASWKYRGADKSLVRPGRKQAAARIFLCSYIIFILIISTIYLYKKTSIKGNIFTLKLNYSEVGRAKDLSAPRLRKQLFTVGT